MGKSLTVQDAYAAMFFFLEEIYQRTSSDTIGALLGSMSLLEDGETADPGVWTDWEEAVQKATEGPSKSKGLMLRLQKE